MELFDEEYDGLFITQENKTSNGNNVLRNPDYSDISEPDNLEDFDLGNAPVISPNFK